MYFSLGGIIIKGAFLKQSHKEKSMIILQSKKSCKVVVSQKNFYVDGSCGPHMVAVEGGLLGVKRGDRLQGEHKQMGINTQNHQILIFHDLIHLKIHTTSLSHSIVWVFFCKSHFRAKTFLPFFIS